MKQNIYAHSLSTALAVSTALLANAAVASAIPFGALTVCSPDDEAGTGSIAESCGYSLATNGSTVETGAEARLGDGQLSVSTRRDGGAAPVPQVTAKVSDTIYFTGGDPAGFPVELTMQVRTRFTGELAGLASPPTLALMSMSVDSTDGSKVGGSAWGAIDLLDGELDFQEIVTDVDPEWTVLPGSAEQVSSAPGEILAKVGMSFNWQPEFEPFLFSAYLTLWDFPGSGDVLLESFNSGIELVVPEGVTMVTGSGQFLGSDQVTDVPAPASVLMVLAGLAALGVRKLLGLKPARTPVTGC